MAELTVVEARTLLARAFVDDPLMVWFFPDDDSRVHACAAMFGLLAEHYLEAGRVDVVRRAHPLAVAMWQWPGGHGGRDGGRDGGQDGGAEAERERLPTTGGLMTALMGPARAGELGGAMELLSGHRPAEPHAYLHLLAVHPDAWRQGLGGELLDRGIAAAREEGLVACLDTMNPANVPFYEGHGMTVHHQADLPAGGPTVWCMSTA